MFFNKVKKIADILAPAIRATLTTPFIGSRYSDRRTGRFNPPASFYDDKYIRGHITGQIAGLLGTGAVRATLSAAQRGLVTQKVFAFLRGDVELDRAFANSLLADMTTKQPDYLRGFNDAVTMIYLGCGALTESDRRPRAARGAGCRN